MEYNEKHNARLAKETRLPNSSDKVWEDILIATTEIDISGKVCKVDVYRNKDGNLEVIVDEKDIFDTGGWLADGTCTEGYRDEIIISKFIHND